MSYLDSGYDKFFSRNKVTSTVMLDDQSSLVIKQITGSTLASGISQSNDGKIRVDWDKKQVVVADGANTRVVLGKIPGTADDIYGIKIYNDEGDLVFDVTSGTANIASQVTVGDSNIVLDGTNKRILINDGTYDRVLIGYDEGGF